MNRIQPEPESGSVFRVFRRLPSFWAGVFFVLFASISVSGQSGEISSVLTPVDVSKDWRVQTGDDPNRAQPEFDDSTWPKTDLVEAWKQPASDGFSWYRRELRLPVSETASFGVIGIAFGQLEFAAGQVFANGREIGAFGTFSPPAPLARPKPAIFRIPVEAIGPDGRVRLAVRLWKDPAHSRHNAFFAGTYDDYQKQFAVGLYEVLENRVELGRHAHLKWDLDRLILAFLFMLASHYHLLMFLTRRERTEYLWFGIGAFSAAVLTFCNSEWAMEVMTLFTATVVKNAFRQVLFISGLIFFCHFFSRPFRMWLVALEIIQVVYLILILIRPAVTLTSINTWVLLLFLPCLVFMVLVTIEERGRGNVEARPFANGFVVALFILFLTMLREFNLIRIPVISHWAMGGLGLSMAIAISHRFNRVYSDLDTLNRDLEHKVVERTEELARANVELAVTISQLEEAQEETNRKNLELDQKIALLNEKNQELIVSHQQADRIFSALALALPGTVLDEKYRLDEKIGEGGFGIVFRATHLTLGRAIAVKVFKPRPGNDNAEAIERFKREGISISRLSHPNIISVLDSGISDQGIAYLVMELLTGTSLAEDLRTAGTTSLKQCVERMIPVCQALAEAHRLGIIHRDIKPDNIFINRTPEGELIKVVDFGIAKMIASDTGEDLKKLTATDSLIGTPVYMSPERLSGLDYDGRADVYSVGVVLFELLAGRPPFEKSLSGLVGLMLAHLNDPPPSLRDLNPNIPQSVEDLINRTLGKVPLNRPTAAELAELLAGILATTPAAVSERQFMRQNPQEEMETTRGSSLFG